MCFQHAQGGQDQQCDGDVFFHGRPNANTPAFALKAKRTRPACGLSGLAFARLIEACAKRF
jgi:hypothetical protein